MGGILTSSEGRECPSISTIKYFVESPGEDNKFLIEDGNGAMFRQSCDGIDEVRQQITRDQLS